MMGTNSREPRMMADDETPGTGPQPDDPPASLGRLAQDVAVVLWPSFLAASVATMVCFAFLDPLLFGDAFGSPAWLESRMAGYAVGFFFFWLTCTLSSALTLFLVRTARPAAVERRR